jgi:polyisoprenyl-phosphate glycosyltransferase
MTDCHDVQRKEAAMSQSRPTFSMVVPVLNEEDVIRDTYAKLTGILETLDLNFEVIVVDNGSTDQTPAIVAELCAGDPRWKYIRLSRNFGYQNSITAGMLAASGEAIMVIDADLQDPPELIPQFVAKWREGYDVVYGVREKRVGEPQIRVIPTMLAMRLISWMSDDVKLPLHSGDFRLISRRVRDAFALLSESDRYVRGMIHWLGYRQVGIPYVRQGRTKGHTKVDPLHLIAFTFNAVCSCSVKPLRLFSVLGAGVLGLAASLGVCSLAAALIWGAGFLSVNTLLLLTTLGVQSVGIGILGEYIARIHTQSKGRPLWLVDHTLNFDRNAEADFRARAIGLSGAFPDVEPPIRPAAAA